MLCSLALHQNVWHHQSLGDDNTLVEPVLPRLLGAEGKEGVDSGDAKHPGAEPVA